MKIERDIDGIKKLSEEKEEENRSFRSFLKSGEIPSKKIDIIVQKLSQTIDCQTCRNCCREILPVLKQNDIVNMAGMLNLSVKKFKKKYLEKAKDSDGYTFNTSPCPFLEGNICSIHVARPDDCRSYPHLHKNNFISRTLNVISNCYICPIAFNVYENLKNEIWGMDDFDEYC